LIFNQAERQHETVSGCLLPAGKYEPMWKSGGERGKAGGSWLSELLLSFASD